MSLSQITNAPFLNCKVKDINCLSMTCLSEINTESVTAVEINSNEIVAYNNFLPPRTTFQTGQINFFGTPTTSKTFEIKKLSTDNNSHLLTLTISLNNITATGTSNTTTFTNKLPYTPVGGSQYFPVNIVNIGDIITPGVVISGNIIFEDDGTLIINGLDTVTDKEFSINTTILLLCKP
jgi:hypothetical protein